MLAIVGSGEQIVARLTQQTRKIDLQELLGHRSRSRPVEPLAASVGQDAPAELATGEIVDAAQIA